MIARRIFYASRALAVASALTLTSLLIAAPPAQVEKEDVTSEEIYSPFVGRSYPDKVLFGDTHYHTELSPDAGLLGTTLTASDGYRFARGEKVISNTGQPVQLIRPLDFLVITDHAEYIGLAPMLRESDPLLLADPWGKRIYELFNGSQDQRMQAFGEIIADATSGTNNFSTDEAARNIWRTFLETAEQYNQPGVFSAMTGFEWTSTPNGNNLHRCVIFADGIDKTNQVLPFSCFDSFDPEDLWDWLANYEANTGGEVLCIPHNANLSNGLMFNGKDFEGNDITKAYAEKRSRWEPIHEMTQIKGDEETHPMLSPDDEFANFETWDVANLDGSAPKTKEMLQYEYARSALKLGLKFEKQLGANPYKYGLSATTDTHTGISTPREDNYFGKYAHTEPSPDRHNREIIPADDPSLRLYTAQEAATGLTAVWARENTRQDIFDAMARKEVYGTTGSRLRVRFFVGWDFEADEVERHDFVAEGYKRGVPMGGDLFAGPEGASPTFMIRALRDPDGANLDRIQIIKGWVDNAGKTHERIYDVAVSDDRVIDEDGRCRTPVGSTVDLDTATYTNTIGDPLLTAYWKDPEFDASQHAFYYVRVLEIPIPRWTTYDAVFFGIDRPATVPAEIQDRAYTSPVWYSPGR